MWGISGGEERKVKRKSQKWGKYWDASALAIH
jgi:hypothetical protein